EAAELLQKWVAEKTIPEALLPKICLHITRLLPTSKIAAFVENAKISTAANSSLSTKVFQNILNGSDKREYFNDQLLQSWGQSVANQILNVYQNNQTKTSPSNTDELSLAIDITGRFRLIELDQALSEVAKDMSLNANVRTSGL